MMDDVVRTFIRLFRGRADAYGSWGGPAVRAPLTPEHFERHLVSPFEADWFGVYNVIGDRCSWGCVDIDTDDYALASNIRSALWFRMVPAWVEQTARGFHVWTFPREPLVSALTMRQALTAACRVVGYTPKEVFPKQTKVTGTGLGNFVRLPFNGFLSSTALRTHTPRTFDECGVLADFLTEVDDRRATTERLEALAALVPSPQAAHISVNYEVGWDLEPIVASLPGLAYRIWMDGPLDGNDRSTTFVYLARVMADRGIPVADAARVLQSADERWGKHFLDRGEAGEQIVTRVLRKAYS